MKGIVDRHALDRLDEADDWARPPASTAVRMMPSRRRSGVRSGRRFSLDEVNTQAVWVAREAQAILGSTDFLNGQRDASSLRFSPHQDAERGERCARQRIRLLRAKGRPDVGATGQRADGCADGGVGLITAAAVLKAHLRPPTVAAQKVREGRLELPRPFGHWILSPARLPIPPLSRCGFDRAYMWCAQDLTCCDRTMRTRHAVPA
jgi:hypothetical protein